MSTRLTGCLCVLVVLFTCTTIVTQVDVPQVKITSTKPDLAIENSSESDKFCSLGCGAKASDPDPVDPQRATIRWAYDPATASSPPKCANCWYCERAWYQVSHTSEDRHREKYKKKKGKDGDVHRLFCRSAMV